MPRLENIRWWTQLAHPHSVTKAARRATLVLLLLAWSAHPGNAAPPDAADAAEAAVPRREANAKFEVLTLRGRVVWLAEAMARRHGVKTVPEAATRVLALETADGQLYPLAEDIRGRGFRRDPRLRGSDLELLVRRYHGAPLVQVIRAFEVTAEAKLELDYWCDICAIAMFELKPCDCCQGDIELRRRAVAADGRVIE